MQPREYQDDFSSSFGVITTVRIDEVIYIVGSGMERIITASGGTRLARALVSCDDWIALIRPLTLEIVYNFRRSSSFRR